MQGHGGKRIESAASEMKWSEQSGRIEVMRLDFLWEIVYNG